ncbi:helix-turn-helix domain-containing protein [Microvirga sp. 2TAF3]|uniref:helix-turn-helix domain-containing protein n=1 Tax=Microvirga sp. 2TAF3 TaxID=3233014 RepID=UPI003F960E46
MPEPTKAPSLTDRRIGQRIRLQRLFIGLSQENLAEASGITFQQIQKYEKGTNRISAGRLQEIARVLSVPVGTFYDEMPEDEAKDDLLTAMTGIPQGARLVRAFGAIADSGLRRKALELIEAMAAARA